MLKLHRGEILDKLQTNIKDTALILEGGGMRGVFTASIVNILNENELFFDYVTGISAGSTNTANYLSRDINRTKNCYLELVDDPNFGGVKSFLKKEGFFNSSYIYGDMSKPNGKLPYDYETFKNNPAKFKIGAVSADTGKMVYWGRDDIDSFDKLMNVVRASSSLPIIMPKTEVDGKLYYDGGLAGGIALDIAKEDGYSKFFIVRTRKRDYRKVPLSKREKTLLKPYFKNHPYLYELMKERYKNYNNTLDEIENLEREGRAYVVYPEHMFIESKDTNKEKLIAMYDLGYNQGMNELENWKKFLLEG